jgi:protein-tyrosine-phosphatase
LGFWQRPVRQDPDDSNLKVLFVCSGNVFRSQIAEAFFSRYTKKNSSTSAGVNARNLHHADKTLEKECPLVVQLMAEVGIDVAKNRSKQLSKTTARVADMIISLTSIDDLPSYLKKDKRLRVWRVSDLEPPDSSKLSQPISAWARESVGRANYRFFRERRDQTKTRVMELIKEIG